MNAREAFKQGVMAHLIEQGYTTPSEMLQVIKEAQAENPVSTGLGLVKDTVGVGKDLLNWVLPAALLAPPIAGYVGGRLAANMTSTDDFDPDEAKRQEIIDEYDRQSQAAQRRGLLRKYQKSQPTGPSRSFF